MQILSLQLVSIFRKIYNKGALWVFRRIRQEFYQPSNNFVLDALVAFKKTNRRLKSIFFKEKKDVADYVTAVYDLNVAPITYDFAYFLAAAERFALKNKKSKFIVLFIPQGGVEMENEENDRYRSGVVAQENMNYDVQSFMWRFENIILPMMNIYPACIGHSILPKKTDISEAIKGKFLYPEFYSESFPKADFYRDFFASKTRFIGFSASIQGKRYIESWKNLKKITGKVVAITLRRYNYDPLRNSNVEEWVRFARFVKEKGFTPVFIPDTETCFEHDPRLDDFIVFEAPCWNLGIRMALYEEVDLNFFTSNGVGNIVILNGNAASIIMKKLVPGSMHASVETFSKVGVSLGKKTHDLFEGHFQVLSWKDDTFEDICEEFNSFLAEKT